MVLKCDDKVNQKPLCSPRSNTTKRIYEPSLFPIMENKRFWKAKDGSCLVKNRKREIKFHGRQWQPWNYLWVLEKRGGWFELDMLVINGNPIFTAEKETVLFLKSVSYPFKNICSPSPIQCGTFCFKKDYFREMGKKGDKY